MQSQHLDSSLSWDGSNMYHPSMDARPRMEHRSPIMWNQPGGPVNVVPSTPSVPRMPGGATHPQLTYTGAPFGVQPDGSLFPGPPARAMSLSAPTEMASQYPDPNHYPQVSPDLKRRMTSPGQSIGPMANAAMANVHTSQVPAGFPGHTPTMGYQPWPTMGEIPGGPAYPMYHQERLPGDFNSQPTTRNISPKSSSGA